MLFYSYFKTLVGKEVTVELKNDLAMKGTLHSVDQYLNIKLNNVHVVNEQKYPHMVRLLGPLPCSPFLFCALQKWRSICTWEGWCSCAHLLTFIPCRCLPRCL